MSLDHWLLVMISVILAIGALGMIGNIQLANFYRAALRLLHRYEQKTEYKTKDSDDLLQHISQEYAQHRLRGIEAVNTQAIIEKHVYAKEIRLLGLLRFPLSVVERLMQQFPSWVIILGLLGTFTGLTLALFSMQNTLLQFGHDTGGEMIRISTIVAAIAEPFKGMSVAFLTSIAGIGSAFILYLLQSGFLAKLGIGPNYLQYKQQFLTRCEAWLDHQVQLYVQEQKPKDTLERILDRFADKVKLSFTESVASFGKEILHLTERLNASIEGLENVVLQSGKLTTAFAEGTGKLTEFGHKLEHAMQQLFSHETQVAQRVHDVGKQLQLLQQEIKTWSQKSSDGQANLQRVVERSDQLLQQYSRKTEEWLQWHKQQGEELMRTVYDQLEEQGRRNAQQQEELFYRFQEKNDQYSRAAESFGQAVAHLERQWEDGLERFKREAANQWAQVLERAFQRQQQSHGGEKEMRDIARGLEAILHLLEREFEHLYRFAQEANQILHMLYEWGRSAMSHSRYVQDGTVVRERKY